MNHHKLPGHSPVKLLIFETKLIQMRTVLLIAAASVAVLALDSCTKIRGCTEKTADNYLVTAEEDDGTCIPSRDKIIGNYNYTRKWTDVVDGNDYFSFGTIQITEANTAINAYNTNFDGDLFLQGSISADQLIFEMHSNLTYSYTGTGTWRRSDTVNLVLDIVYDDAILPIPQPITFYCSKLPS